MLAGRRSRLLPSPRYSGREEERCLHYPYAGAKNLPDSSGRRGEPVVDKPRSLAENSRHGCGHERCRSKRKLKPQGGAMARLLLVDDDPGLLQAQLGHALGPLGVEIDVALNGA